MAKASEEIDASPGADDDATTARALLVLCGLAWLGLAAAACTVYLVTDDWWHIERVMSHGVWWGLDPATPGRLFYRPLTQDLYFRIMLAVFGLRPIPYHLANMIIHAGSIALAVLVARQVTGKWIAAAVAGFLYATTPVSFWIINFVSGIHDHVMTLAFLGSALLFLRYSGSGGGDDKPKAWALALSPLLYLVSLLAKETGLWLPIWLWAHDVARGVARGDKPLAIFRGRLLRHLPHDLILAAFMVFRFIYIPLPKSGDYAMSWLGPHIPARLDEFLHDAFISLGLPDLGRGSPYFIHAIIAAIILAALLAYWLRRRRFNETVLSGLAWFFIGIAIFLPFERRTFDYFIYLASIGLFWCVGEAASWLMARLGAKKGRAIIIAAALVIMAVSGYRHYRGHQERFIPRAARATRALHEGIKSRYKDFPPNARIIIFSEIRVGDDPTHFGIRALYGRMDLQVFAESQAYEIEKKGGQYVFTPRPGFDFKGVYGFAYTHDQGFMELYIGPDGSVPILARPKGG